MQTLNGPPIRQKKGVRYAAVTALSLAAGFTANANAAGNSELEQLKEQLKLLQNTVGALQKKVEKAEADASQAKEELTTLQASAPATVDDVQAVQSDLENFKWQWDRTQERTTVKSTRNVTLGGVVQGRYGWNEQPITNATTNETDNSFDISTVLLSARGNLYRDYEEGRNLDFAISFGASPQASQANLGVLDAYISYNVFPTINLEEPKLQLSLGQQLLPFGLEVPATEDLKPLITNAQFTTALGLSARQIGFIARGDLFPMVDYGTNYRAATLEYAAGVVNGSGPNRSDDNSEKDFIGRLAFTLPVDYNSWFRELKFGVSGYYGTQNVRLNNGLGAIFDTGDKHRAGFDVSYNHNPIGVTFEYVRAWDDFAAGTTPAAPEVFSRQAQSFTTTLFYNHGAQFVRGFRNQAKYDDWWPTSIQPFVRWDRFDPDLDAADDIQDIFTPGINIFFAETTKLQLNYRAKLEEKFDIENDEFQAQVQFGF
jgi:hypothetical protein